MLVSETILYQFESSYRFDTVSAGVEPYEHEAMSAFDDLHDLIPKQGHTWP